MTLGVAHLALEHAPDRQPRQATVQEVQRLAQLRVSELRLVEYRAHHPQVRASLTLFPGAGPVPFAPARGPEYLEGDTVVVALVVGPHASHEQRCPRRARAAPQWRRRHHVDEARVGECEDGLEDLLLGAELVLRRTPGHAGATCDSLGGGRGIAVLADQGEGGLYEGGARALGLQCLASGAFEVRGSHAPQKNIHTPGERGYTQSGKNISPKMFSGWESRDPRRAQQAARPGILRTPEPRRRGVYRRRLRGRRAAADHGAHADIRSVHARTDRGRRRSDLPGLSAGPGLYH